MLISYSLSFNISRMDGFGQSMFEDHKCLKPYGTIWKGKLIAIEFKRASLLI